MTPASDRAALPPLACTVRDCGRPLERRGRTFICAGGHSHDIARSGYVNLLQPQDRRSRAPGDAKASIDARAAVLASGVGRALLDAVVDRVAAFNVRDGAVVVDLGSGAGDALAALASRQAITGVGIDISTAAADHAARRFPDMTWIVANADRRLPLLDGRVDLVLSLYGRRNPIEVARVLSSHGVLLIALPAPDDLIELRTLVQGQAVARARGDAMLVEHHEMFVLIERQVVSETVELDRDGLLRLLRGTYRGARLGVADRVAELTPMRVTLSSDVFVLRLK